MKTMNLLIVDDEERFLKTTSELLKKRGVNTYTSARGSDAMDVLDNEEIDVIILDVKMPGLDGIDVLRVIKKRYPLVEVILLTGHASAESAIEGINLGAFDYLIKPCDIQLLFEKAKEAHEKVKTKAVRYRK